MVLSLVPVNEVKTLGLDLTVDEGTGETSTVATVRTCHIHSHRGIYSQELLSLLVAGRLAVAGAVLLVSLGSLVGGGSGNELVGQGSLVLMGLSIGDLWTRRPNEVPCRTVSAMTRTWL